MSVPFRPSDLSLPKMPSWQSRRGLIDLSFGARCAPILRPSSQAAASLFPVNSSPLPAPPGRARRGGSCFTHPPAAILIPRRMVQGDP
jgi:hypothetical protein